jgi:hypothetical protein
VGQDKRSGNLWDAEAEGAAATQSKQHAPTVERASQPGHLEAGGRMHARRDQQT